jgi:16S rRNA (guanine527-N7)-methyltransferase
MLQDAVDTWIHARGWVLPDVARARLDTLLGLWLRYGPVMNLSGARTEAELIPQILDGLDTAWLVREVVGDAEDMRWLDFGSGGGFPGLVVAAVGQWPMMFVEPRQKRVAFLELALRSIGRESIGVRKARFGRTTWGKDPANGFFGAVGAERRVVSARAVWSPEEWLGVAAHVGGGRSHVVMHLNGLETAEKFAPQRVVESQRGVVALVRVADSPAT